MMKKIMPEDELSVAAESRGNSSHTAAARTLIVGWGHEGGLRQAFTSLICGTENASHGDDGVGYFSSATVEGTSDVIALFAGEEEFRLAHLRAAADSGVGLILIDINRGVDDVIHRQCVILAHAGVPHIIAVVGGDGPVLSRVRLQ